MSKKPRMVMVKVMIEKAIKFPSTEVSLLIAKRNC